MKKNQLLLLLLLFAFGGYAQSPTAPTNLKMLGTRTWIRLSWIDNATNEQGYKIYLNTSNVKPSSPRSSIAANSNRYYIDSLGSQTLYYVWVEAYNVNGSSNALSDTVRTIKNWIIDPNEVANLSIPSSSAVPAGMQLFWHDEFNDRLVNRNKWTSNYYGFYEARSGIMYQEMQNNTLPQPVYRMTDSSLVLVINSSSPRYYPSPDNKSVSSFQTFDWATREHYLNNEKGGYYEVRARRKTTSQIKTTSAYWFESQDLKYWQEKGNTFNPPNFGTVTGVRPHGQAFEIDVYEQYDNATTAGTTAFTMHGNVAPNGTFQGNLTTYNAPLSGQDNWNTYGVLWTPSAIKYYINGVLQKEWSDKNNLMSPNHELSIFLGLYGVAADSATMEYDYIRGYQWPVINGSELPNGGAEYSTQLYPWEGTATVSANQKRTGNNGFVLNPGQTLTQYVYLNNSRNYQLKYWLNGNGSVLAEVSNITPVTGGSQDNYADLKTASSTFAQHILDFKTGAEPGNDLKTVKVSFRNTGSGTITLDDIEFQKGGSGGNPDTSTAYCIASGGANATDRYIAALSTTNATRNISYTGSAYPANGYGYFTSDSIVARAGSSFTLNMTNSTNTKWSRVKVYADWNGNGSFNDAGETVLSLGNASQDNSATVLNISSLITVPTSSVLGKTRIRVRFYDAWNNDPGPCGQVNFTTTQDYILNIVTASVAYCPASGGTHATDRYITSLSTLNATHNINYTNSTYPPNGYGYFTADSITVATGTSFTLNMTNSTNTKWSRVKVYADWNGNGNFADAGETILSVGNANQDNSAIVLNISGTVSVPATAALANTRMRVRFYDAWNSDPGSCGQVNYSTTQDFNIFISPTMSPGNRSTDDNNFSHTLNSMNDDTKEKKTEIKLYPVPAKDVLMLSGSFPAGTVIRISDAKGQIVSESVLNNKKIDISRLTAGTYFLQIIEKNNTVYHSRFIKK